MTNETDNAKKTVIFGDEMNLARFLHQDQLMWGRLQTIMAIQTAAIALAWYNHDSPKLATTMMGFGIGISGCLCVLYGVDRILRNRHNTELGNFHKDYRTLGMVMFWIIVALFSIADVLTLLGLRHGWLK